MSYVQTFGDPDAVKVPDLSSEQEVDYWKHLLEADGKLIYRLYI